MLILLDSFRPRVGATYFSGFTLVQFAALTQAFGTVASKRKKKLKGIYANNKDLDPRLRKAFAVNGNAADN